MKNFLRYFCFIGLISQFFISYAQILSDLPTNHLLQEWSERFHKPLTYDEASADWLFRKAKAEIVSQESQGFPLMLSDEELEQRRQDAIQHLQVAIKIYEESQNTVSIVHAKRYYITACQRWRRSKKLYGTYVEEIQDYDFSLPQDLRGSLNFSTEKRSELYEQAAKRHKGLKLLANASGGSTPTFGVIKKGPERYKQWWLFFLASIMDRGNQENELSVTMMKAVEDIYRLNGLEIELLDLYMVLGEFIAVQGKLEEALTYDYKSLAIAEKYETLQPRLAHTLFHIGDIYEKQGKYALALKYFEASENKLDSIVGYENHISFSYQTHIGLGKGFLRMRLTSIAKKHFDQSKAKIDEELPKSEGETKFTLFQLQQPLYGELAQYYTLTNQLERALETGLKSLAISQQIPAVYAEFAKKRAVKMYAKMIKPVDAYAYTVLGLVSFQLGEYEKGLIMIDSAVHIFNKYEWKKEEGIYLMTKGILLANFPDRRQEALKLFFQADSSQITHGLEGNRPALLKNLAALYLEMGKWQEAEETGEKALSLAQQLEMPVNEAIALSNLAYLHLIRKRFDKVRPLCDSSLKILKRHPYSQTYFDNHVILGRLSLAENNPEKALQFFREAIRELDDQFFLSPGELSQQIINTDAMHAYEGAIEAYAQLGQHAKAFEMSEKAKGRTLSQLLARAELDKRLSPRLLHLRDSLETEIQKIKLRQRERNISQDQQATLKVNMDLTTSRHKLVWEDIKQQAPEYYDIFLRDTLKIQELQGMLEDDEVHLNYFVGTFNAYVFVITNEKVKTINLGPAYVLKNSAKALEAKFIYSRPDEKLLGDFYKTSYNLYQKTITPIRDFIDLKDKKILIVRDDILNMIPFEILVSNEEAPKKFKDFDYLVKSHAIKYYPSSYIFTRQYAESTAKTYANNDMLILAGSTYEEEATDSLFSDWNMDSFLRSGNPKNLKYAAQEGEKIAELFPEQSSLYTYKNASEDQLKALNRIGELKKYRYIHLATHGFIDPIRPELSMIMLSRHSDFEEDGDLHLFEMLRLEMAPELIVLSACETGRGRIRAGEGIIGFMRGLMYAGCRNMILSLWQVDDLTTSKLFVDFYQKLKENGEQDKHEAFRNAQLEMIKNEDYANPYYWGGFIYTGN